MSNPTPSLLHCSLHLAWTSALLVACALAGPVLAQQDDLADRVWLDGRAPATRISQTHGEPLATTGPTPVLGVWSGRSTVARQTMVWMQPRHGALSLGVGVEQRAPFRDSGALQRIAAAAPETNEAGVLVGVALATSQRSQLTLQTPLLNASRAPGDELWTPLGSETREVRMGLVFHTSNRYAELRRGVRVELSGQTTLSFRPRGGRIGMTLQSRW